MKLIDLVDSVKLKVEYFSSPEKSLKHALDKNPFFPFVQTESYKYEFQYRFIHKSISQLLLSVTCFIITVDLVKTILYLNCFDNFLLLFCTLLAAFFQYFCLYFQFCLFKQKK